MDGVSTAGRRTAAWVGWETHRGDADVSEHTHTGHVRVSVYCRNSTEHTHTNTHSCWCIVSGLCSRVWVGL